MLYHLSSTDPSDYGLIKINLSSLNQSKRIVYRVSSMSTQANFYVTTDDDYIIIDNIKYMFSNHGAYDMNTFPFELGRIIGDHLITIDSLGRVMLHDTSIINEATHRVKLLLGLYHTDLPLTGDNNIITCPSAPYLCFGNILNLMARHGLVVGTNTNKNKEEYHCIIYKSAELLYQNLPVICRHIGVGISSNCDQFRNLEFRLVDFMLHEVKLLAPLHVTIEVSSDDTIMFGSVVLN